MRAVSKRDLNQRTAEVLAQVIESGEIVVTERGTPRWRVSVFREESSALERLEREGRYTPPPAEPTPWAEHVGGPAYSEAEVDALLEEMKGEY
ncbi:MAG: hypothetical protein BGN97_14115 [Microbacterium sp. 69-10]|uniref:hypothetical protein n=1 Tax=Microbacterium sp. 69-10 TaxID=1895783 RepID=UPI00096324A1|nr:hypothetical protein [Microbacterium sp. 69-10]OJU39954.1 MAG: hypothetical protein BGN97_14115 [Microbacterium sp. 69-10]